MPSLGIQSRSRGCVCVYVHVYVCVRVWLTILHDVELHWFGLYPPSPSLLRSTAPSETWNTSRRRWWYVQNNMWTLSFSHRAKQHDWLHWFRNTILYGNCRLSVSVIAPVAVIPTTGYGFSTICWFSLFCSDGSIFLKNVLGNTDITSRLTACRSTTPFDMKHTARLIITM